MRQNILALLGTTAIVAVLAEPATAQAQSRGNQNSPHTEQSQQQRSDSRQQSARQGSEAMTEQEFVRSAAIVNAFEVRAGEIGRDKARNQEVRDLADRIVNDHQRMRDRLSQAAGKTNIPSQLDRRHSNLIDRLERTSAERFDRRFIRMQVRGHEQAIDDFEAYIQAQRDQGPSANRQQSESTSTSGQGTQGSGQAGETVRQRQEDASRSLLQYAQQHLPTLRQHLRIARSIQEDMQQDPNVAGREAQPGRTTQQSRADSARSQQSASRNDQATHRFVVEQPRPQITVTDPRSQVTVQQPQPRVTVRQQPPTVTIEQPPPEIIVQMPRPEVDLQNREPRVSVNVPRPEVRVERQGKSAHVRVQPQSDNEAQVQYERARPQVTFERSGQPRVVYRSTQDEPNVRYENARESDSAGNQQSEQNRSQSEAQASRQQMNSQPGQQSDASQRQAASRRAGQSDEDWREQARELAGGNDNRTATTGSAASAPAARGTVLTVGQIMDMPIYNARGQNLGEVEDVVVDQTNDRTFVILSSGGFLGMFEDEVALPLERFTARADRLIVSGLSEDDIDNMQDWEDRIPNSRALDESSSVRVGG